MEDILQAIEQAENERENTLPAFEYLSDSDIENDYRELCEDENIENM